MHREIKKAGIKLSRVISNQFAHRSESAIRIEIERNYVYKYLKKMGAVMTIRSNI